MELEKSILEDHQAQIVVEVEPDRLESARRRAARSLAARGKIPGFRPGKAPYDVILRHYGDSTVNEQAIDLLVDEIYPEVLKEAGINPAAAGHLEKIEGTGAPKFTFKVPLAPEVRLGDYHQVQLPYDFEAPTPDKLVKALEDLRRAYASTETVNRPAAEGDYILVDLSSDKETLKRKGMAVVIPGAENPHELPFPGFAHKLLGARAGEARILQHAFPADHEDATLAGQDVQVEASVKEVRSMTLPALDDEFAKTVGPYESLDALKVALANDLEAHARAEYDDEYYTRLVDRIREESAIKYAPQTLDHEAEHVVDDLRQRLAQQGLDLETYYKMRKTDASGFLEDEAKPLARRRLERSLVLDEIARAEKIEVDNGALDQEFNNTVIDLQTRGVNFSSIRGGKQGQQRVAEALAMQSANRLLTRRTLDRLKTIATGQDPSAASPGAQDHKDEGPSSTETGPSSSTGAELDPAHADPKSGADASAGPRKKVRTKSKSAKAAHQK